MIEGVIFDLWNTLIRPKHEFHTMKLIKNMYKIPDDLYREEMKKGLMTTPLETVQEISDYMKKQYGLKHRSDTEKLLLQKQMNLDIKNVELYPETIKTLKTIKGMGLKIGLISNASSPHKKPFYEFRLQKFFDYTCFSCDVGYWKPESEIYLQTLELMRLKPKNTIMVGDNKIKDYQVPSSLGMRGVHLDRNTSSDTKTKVQELSEIIRFVK